MGDETMPISAHDLVAEAQGDTDEARAISIARRLLTRSQQLQTPHERRQQAELNRMIGHPTDKATLVEMTDQAFRTMTPARVADQLTHILDLQGVPRFFNPLERTMLRGFQSFGEYLPGVAVPLVKQKMRAETANVILPAEEEMLTSHLRKRQADGVRMNVNFLGEALLGEQEARRRLKSYLSALRSPDIECISVKITTIDSQVSALDRDRTVDRVANRLELLYRAAQRESFLRHDGSTTTKFVYLDMEEYRDLHLTTAAMRRALSREGLHSVRAGIALQAYIPDSAQVLETLLAWSHARVDKGGEPLTIRLVKGANMEMEQVEASLAGWPQAPYPTKELTDANYKRMLRSLLSHQHAPAIRVGVASHNLFDIGLAMLWASREGVLDNVQFEMLEGMANHQRRAIDEVTASMLLYAPACRREEFLTAIGYLIRRLDENTGPENFLRHSFELEPDTPVWHQLATGFRDSLACIDTVENEPRRQQDRRQRALQPPVAEHWSLYKGDPDTDWSLPYHANWAAELLERWKTRADSAATEIPLVIAGEDHEASSDQLRASLDPSRPGVVSCRYREATVDEIEQAVACAHTDSKGWRQTTLAERHAILRQTAQLLRERRGDLIGAAVADGGKTVAEADPEVSEAIDFAEFYPLTMADVPNVSGLQAKPRGVVAVVSPWNFPLAIPCGGVAAALAAGNTVILKPASDTVLPAYLVAQCFWDAGVPKEALQFTPCAGSRGGRALIEDARVDTVILTGGTATARQMLHSRPGLQLIAETGGKNATIVSALSDRELAIKHVLHSAFSHSGQKCSATSLLLLEEEVYEDPKFRETLRDAAASLPVGSAWDLETRIGPLIRPPRGELARGMKELEPGEAWLVMPERPDDNPHLYRPGIKWNVKAGGFTHTTELFGPVLGAMRYRRLEDAIATVNATGYGLTSGLESLDDREQTLWQQTIRAGNLYINRPTTGAIVLRQPFGGVGSSAYGPGLKAGGPHYVLPLLHLSSGGSRSDASDEQLTGPLAQLLSALQVEAENGVLPDSLWKTLQQAAREIHAAQREEYSQEHDTVQLLGQDNLRRYRAVNQMRIRVRADDALQDVLVAIAAAIGVDCVMTVSCTPHVSPDLLDILELLADTLPSRIEILEETPAELAAAIVAGSVDRLRTLSPRPLSDDVFAACTDAFVSIVSEPVCTAGAIEALRYLSEQTLSFDYHRYGNLGRRHRKTAAKPAEHEVGPADSPARN